MNSRTCIVALFALSVFAGVAGAASPGPSGLAPVAPIPAPVDKPFPGEIQLRVDASDSARRIFRVHETISGISGDTVLLYPKWLPGTHSPEGAIERVAGLRISAQGTEIGWTRDPADVYAFRVH